MKQSMKEQTSILVVEDDEDIRDLIVDQLVRQGYHVFSAPDNAHLQALYQKEQIDLIILDRNLPDGDGLDVCRQMRREGMTVPVILVTARGTALDRIDGLEQGGDDYLTKPFEPRELLARVRNLLRRAGGNAGEEEPRWRIAHFGAWRLDLFHRRLMAPDGGLVMLSSAEFRLLRRFLDEPNKTLSREELLPERRATVAFDRSIDLQISRLRQKLSAVEGGAGLVVTVRNEGYVLACPVRYE
ncbi:MAG: response regulator transcription factor [Sphingobium sp.]|nr:response regulator transcription factor [Sphingobium sp.]